jgi:ribosomal-protein-alanine N-acetyltransferase
MQEGHLLFPELETARLRLRQLSDADQLAVFSLRSDPQVNKFINREKPKRPEQASEFISRINKDISGGRSFYWAISISGNSDLVGVICLWNFSEDRKSAELGYELMPRFQKQGIMQEAVSRVLRFAFEQIYLERIEAFTHKKNINSIKLLRKKGFIHIPGRSATHDASDIIFLLNKNSYK